jgi:hypothetical protein
MIGNLISSNRGDYISWGLGNSSEKADGKLPMVASGLLNYDVGF